MRASSDKCIYFFGEEVKVALHCKSGQVITMETKDCFSNQLEDKKEIENINWNNINPATGPIYVEEAEEGDVLKITILDINVNGEGFILAGEKLGVFGDSLKGTTTKTVKIEDNKVIFNDKISIPLEPMIGVIGVYPKEDKINSGTPREHGGNMDNKKIKKGSTVYLPVFKKGGYIALGDLHAAMGDGEIGGSGVEVKGEVTLKIEVIKEDIKLSSPMIKDDKGYYTVASGETLDEAIEIASYNMANILMEKTNISFEETVMLLSICGDLEICQVVDPLKTVRLFVPLSIFKSYDIEF
ncbi:acetamidase/formamidase family protein [Clostridium hydrogeniformans]|uniref:acetamidase/formamidase family protein n=1 Tax=Clostridium hydrogeniformans TaxID=349933 RepID=UPI0004835293|nr:acetamidase/formamidase family protein [Clostridium hydrogeniformans]